MFIFVCVSEVSRVGHSVLEEEVLTNLLWM